MAQGVIYVCAPILMVLAIIALIIGYQLKKKAGDIKRIVQDETKYND